MEKLSKHPSAPAFTMPTAARVTLVSNTGPNPTGLAYDVTLSPKHVPTTLMSKTVGRTNWDTIPPTLAAVEAAGKPGIPILPCSPKGLDMARSHGRELPMVFMGAPAPCLTSSPAMPAAAAAAVAADGGYLPAMGVVGPGLRKRTPPITPPGTLDMKRTTGRKSIVTLDDRPALDLSRDELLRPRNPSAQFERSLGRKQPMPWFEVLEDFPNSPTAPCSCDSPKQKQKQKRKARVEAMGRTTGREAKVVHAIRMVPDKHITKDIQHDYKDTCNHRRGLPMGPTPHSRADINNILSFCDAQLRLLRNALATSKADTPKSLQVRPPPAPRLSVMSTATVPA
eukprot:GGOE01028897.1.p1 GENE.GGOE01028897.1~~GGOE01028897.1.p1  ORF type:complete len:339 (-),score=37.11 GGOE01028897.1:1105-2121(-)